MLIYICICIYVYMYIYTKKTKGFLRTNTRSIYTHVDKITYATHIHACIYTCLRVHMHTVVWRDELLKWLPELDEKDIATVCICIYIFLSLSLYIYIYTYIYIYIYIYIYKRRECNIDCTNVPVCMFRYLRVCADYVSY
jgi:hypothetical protein